jgi:predicted PurR-regulated permease PerM
MNDEKVLDISWGTILKIASAFVFIYFAYLVKDILIWIVFALVISVLADPAIDFLKRLRFPRVLSTILIYVLIFSIFGGLIYFIIPFFAFEIQQFTQLFPQYFEKIAPPLSGLGVEAFESMEVFTGTIEGWLMRASSNIFNAIAVIFGGIISTMTIFMLAIFLSIEEKGVDDIIALLSPKKYERIVLAIWKKSKLKVSKWFGMRLILSVFVGLLTFIACHILNVRYAVSFGLLVGISDIIPIIGPVFSGVVIILFCALESWVKALFIMIILVLIQQIEGSILTPILTKKVIGLPPALVLVALLIGGRLWGVLGAILAIPLLGLFYEFFKNFLREKKEAQAELQ